MSETFSLTHWRTITNISNHDIRIRKHCNTTLHPDFPSHPSSPLASTYIPSWKICGNGSAETRQFCRAPCINLFLFFISTNKLSVHSGICLDVESAHICWHYQSCLGGTHHNIIPTLFSLHFFPSHLSICPSLSLFTYYISFPHHFFTSISHLLSLSLPLCLSFLSVLVFSSFSPSHLPISSFSLSLSLTLMGFLLRI